VHPTANTLGLAMTEMCPFGECDEQFCTVRSCPQTKLEDGLPELYSSDDVAL